MRSHKRLHHHFLLFILSPLYKLWLKKNTPSDTWCCVFTLCHPDNNMISWSSIFQPRFPDWTCFVIQCFARTQAMLLFSLVWLSPADTCHVMLIHDVVIISKSLFPYQVWGCFILRREEVKPGLEVTLSCLPLYAVSWRVSELKRVKLNSP